MRASFFFFLLKTIQLSYAQQSPCPKEEKNPTQFGHHMWKILAPTFGQHMEPLPKHKQCQTNKILHVWSQRFLYIILAHVVVGTTLHEWIPSFHTNCHLLDCKPIKILCGNQFRVAWAFKGKISPSTPRDPIILHNTYEHISHSSTIKAMK